MHLKKFNGQSIINIKQLKTLIDQIKLQYVQTEDNSTETYDESSIQYKDSLVFEFSSGRVLILDCRSAFDSLDEVRD